MKERVSSSYALIGYESNDATDWTECGTMEYGLEKYPGAGWDSGTNMALIFLVDILEGHYGS